jgi:hypothetical protein
MLKISTIALLISVSTPAMACHRFHRWYYPWPQRCRVDSNNAYHAQTLSPTEDKSWYVEIILTPQVLDEISHGLGIERIKQLQEERNNANYSH